MKPFPTTLDSQFPLKLSSSKTLKDNKQDFLIKDNGILGINLQW